ncbi:MAG: hypothetical protein J6C93_01140 [Clostridia bacterium]|nr:hypothetical protein [Clostridia bacterium]
MKKQLGKTVALSTALAVAIGGGMMLAPMVGHVAGASSYVAGETHNVYNRTAEVNYTAVGLTEDAALNGSGITMVTGLNVGNWGGYDGWTVRQNGGIRYDYQGVEGGAPRISQFYTMMPAGISGFVEVNVTVDKLQEGKVLDYEIAFYDTVLAKKVGITDLTDKYNALPVGNDQTITVYVDLGAAQNIDSVHTWVKADTATAQFAIDALTVELGASYLSSANGYFAGVSNGFNVVFNKMTQENTSKNYDMMPVTGYSGEYGVGYDSGRHGNYGFNLGAITVHNDEDGEYMRFGHGDNNCAGIWMKFPLDVSGGSVHFNVTLMKEVEGNCQEVKFEFIGANNNTGTTPVIINNDGGLPNGSGLSSLPAGEWVTLDYTVNVSGMTSGFDSLGIWIECSGADNQAIRIKNFSVTYDDAGMVREEALTQDEKTVDGITYASEEGIVVKSDYTAKEYVELTLGEEAIAGTTDTLAIADGSYKGVVTFRKTAALSDSFAFDLVCTKDGAAVNGATAALAAAIKQAEVGEWVTVETPVFDVMDGAIDGIGYTCSGAVGDVLHVKQVALVQETAYLAKDTDCTTLGILHTPVTDEAVEATCEETGLTEGSHCSVCGKTLTAQTEVPAKGHTPGEWEIDKEATVDEAGSKHKDCTVCGETVETEEIPALPAEDPEEGGCGAVVGGVSAGLMAAAVAAVAIVRKKR